MIRETYKVSPTTSFDIEIAPAPSDGKKYPVVVVVHGNFGLVDPFGDLLRKFTEEIAAVGYLAALPTYYPAGKSDPEDTNIATHLPALTGAVKHLSNRKDCDPTRLGVVGFSLGGGIAASYINSSPSGTVAVFADYYGLVKPVLAAGVAKFPPTIIFHNAPDPVVPVAENSEPLADALDAAGIVHDPIPPYSWYDDHWKQGALHAFEPNGHADVDSRKRTHAWLKAHLPPVGKP